MDWMSRKKDKAARAAEEPQQPNAFGALDALGNLPPGPENSVPVKTSKRGQKNKWAIALNKARRALNIKGFQAIGGKSAKGQALLKKTRSFYKN